MNLIKRLTAAVLAVVFFMLSFAPSTSAATVLESATTGEGGTRHVEVIFRSTDEAAHYDFAPSITDEATGQTFYLWGAEYEVLSSATHRNDDVRYIFEYTDLYDAEVPKTIEYVNPINGKTYTLPLLSSTYSATTITDRSGSVIGMIEFGWQTYIPKPKDEIEIEYFDEPSGETVRGIVAFRDLVLDRPFQWRDFEIEVTFEVYEAEYYKMNGQEIYIPYSGDGQPAIAGLENRITKALGEDPSRFIIKTATWTDEVHEENGIEVRHAVFTGTRYVAKYVANYESEWTLPDCPGFNASATYGMNMDVLDGTTEYTIRGVATYQVIPLAGAIAIGVGVFILIVGAVILLLVLAKRKKKEREDEKGTGSNTVRSADRRVPARQ